METAYDFATVAIFAGLIVLFLERSLADSYSDSLWQYLVASVGCAVANYLGNQGYHIPAILLISGTLVFIFHVLRPFDKWLKK